MRDSARFKNTNNYCEYYKDFGHTTFDCCELKKALNEPAN